MKQSRRIPRGTLYLVGVPEGEVMKEASQLQRWLDRRFDLFQGRYPPLHVTLNVLCPQGKKQTQKAFSKIRSALEGRPPFSITVRGAGCFALPYKSLHLRVEKMPPLSALSRRVHRDLARSGIPSLNMEEWNYHITLVNPLFARREWSLREFAQACRLVEKYKPRSAGRINRMELWSTASPPFHRVASFVLGKGPEQ